MFKHKLSLIGVAVVALVGGLVLFLAAVFLAFAGRIFVVGVGFHRCLGVQLAHFGFVL